MKVMVMSDGQTLDAPVSGFFARAPYYLIVDTDTLSFDATMNPAVGAAGGAGVQAAQFAASKGVEAVIAGNVGPNALGALRASNIPVYAAPAMTVRQAVEALKEGKLTPVAGATAPQAPYAGYGYGMGYGRGGYGPGFGAGGGYGRGMGRGGGRGRGRGWGRKRGGPRWDW